MRSIFALVAISSTLALSGCMADAGPDIGENEDLEQADVSPVEKAITPTFENAPSNFSSGQAGATVNISSHGGPVMSSPIKIYYIWYGGWSSLAPNVNPILTDLANGFNGSGWWNINSGYGASTSITFGGATSVSTSGNYSKKLTDSTILSIVSSAITGGALPKDSNGIYFLLTSPDVTATSGFCTKYCGWHTHATVGGTDIKYSFVGDPATKCPSSCEMYLGNAPNGDSGADAMASIIAHEAAEAATDPDLNAFYDSQGYENADKCAWTFGAETVTNGQHTNVTLGSRKFLVQQNWKYPGQACGLQ